MQGNLILLILIQTRMKDNLFKGLKLGYTLFLAMTILTAIDFILNLVKSPILDYMDLTAWLYFIPTSFGHAALFSLLILIVYCFVFVLTRSKRTALYTFILLAIFLQVFFVLDGLVFNIYRFHINGFVLQLLLGAGANIFTFGVGVVLKFIVLIGAVAVIPYLLISILATKYYNRLRGKTVVIISSLLLVCIVFSHVGHAVAAGVRQVSIQKSATILPYFFPLTMNSLLLRMGITDKNDFVELSDLDVSDINYPKNIIRSSDSIPNYNILYILVDSWNPDTFTKEITPNIYNFSNRGHVFTNHISSSSGTHGSVFGLFFGAPLTYKKDFQLADKSPILIDQLLYRDYDIEVFPSAIFTAPPFHEEVFKRVPTINTQVFGNTPFQRDSTITEMTIDYIKNRKGGKPFFALTFYDTAHAMSIPDSHNIQFQPAWAEADYMALSNDIDRTPFFNLYKNCVYYIDYLVGKVLSELDQQDLLDNTVVIITGDHSQEFNENKKNYWGHGSNYTQWQTRVPLIMYYPNIEAKKTYRHMTTHYDISSTTLRNFLGVENPYSDFSIGINMYDTISRYPHILGGDVNYGFLFSDKIIQTNYLGTLEVFDTQMNEMPTGSITAKEMETAIQRKNHFYGN